MNRGVSEWFHNVEIYNARVLEYWSSISIKKSVESKFYVLQKKLHTFRTVGKCSMNWILW
jgi:hypothetical protein